MLVRRSSRDYDETVGALLESLQRRGLKLFARIDHAAAAREEGLDLAEEEVLLFGDPKAGTPLMRSDRRVGVELPLRMLVWRDSEQVLLGYRDPRELQAAYELARSTPALERMAKLLGDLAEEAAG